MDWGMEEVGALQAHLGELELVAGAEQYDKYAIHARLEEVTKLLKKLEECPPRAEGSDCEQLANKLRAIMDNTNVAVQNLVPGLSRRLIVVLQRVVYDHPAPAST